MQGEQLTHCWAKVKTKFILPLLTSNLKLILNAREETDKEQEWPLSLKKIIIWIKYGKLCK